MQDEPKLTYTLLCKLQRRSDIVKNIHHLAILALALVVADGAIAEVVAQRTARQSQSEEIQSLFESMTADGVTRVEIRQTLQDADYEKLQRNRQVHRSGSRPQAAPGSGE